MLLQFCFFLRKAHFKSSFYLQNSEEGCLKHSYGFFLTEAHFKQQYLLLILKKSPLNLVTVFFFYVRGDSDIYNFSQVRTMVFCQDRISVKEGINLEAYEHRDDFIDECISKRCDGYRVLLHIKNNFNYKERICGRCYKILLNIEFKPRDILIIWLNNCKYRVLTNLKLILSSKTNGKRKDNRQIWSYRYQ